MSEKKVVTLRQIAEAINKMPEELKDRPAVTWPSDDSEKGHGIMDIEVLEEDHRFDGDEGCCPESVMKEVYDEWNDEDNYIVHPKGMVILITD